MRGFSRLTSYTPTSFLSFKRIPKHISVEVVSTLRSEFTSKFPLTWPRIIPKKWPFENIKRIKILTLRGAFLDITATPIIVTRVSMKLTLPHIPIRTPCLKTVTLSFFPVLRPSMMLNVVTRMPFEPFIKPKIGIFFVLCRFCTHKTMVRTLNAWTPLLYNITTCPFSYNNKFRQLS